MKFSWRLVKLLESRQSGESLIIEPDPILYRCITLRRFVHGGRVYLPVCTSFAPAPRAPGQPASPPPTDTRPHGAPADIIELAESEARALMGQGLVDPRPRASQLRVSFPGATQSWVGWVPWRMPKLINETDFFRGQPDNSFDSVLVRVKLLKPSMQVCAGLVLQPNETVYLPFLYARAIGGFYSEDQTPRDVSFLVYLDEFVAATMPRPQMANIMEL
jgi:hypothetical protein